jgi:hexosaminidase
MLRGLETLAQLMDVLHVPAYVRQISFAPVHVRDAPRFSYRGLLIDSGRHFLPVPFIKATIGKQLFTPLPTTRSSLIPC